MPSDAAVCDEPQRVVLWRYECLRGAGWPREHAAELAKLQVDLHAACALLASGARPGAAFRLLAPLDYDVPDTLR